MGTAHSSLHLPAWSAALRSHPDMSFVGYILEGIQNGFRVGFNYKGQPTKSAYTNLPTTRDHPEIISNYLAAECSKGRPLPTCSMPNIQINRIGVIPKKSSPGKWRLITDLSFPPGRSVNDGINMDYTSLSYIKVDHIAKKVVQLGKGTQLSKMDIEEAYRLVPIHPDDKHLLGIKWDNHTYIDITLPFGLRSAPIIFTALTDALQWILERRGVSYVAHYLDDFITLGAPESDECPNIQVCQELGIPLAPHKTVGPTTCLIFLGIEIDTMRMELRLPHEKLSKLLELLTRMAIRKGMYERIPRITFRPS